MEEQPLTIHLSALIYASAMLIICYSFRFVFQLDRRNKDQNQHAFFIRSSGDPTTRSSFKTTGMLFFSVNPNEILRGWLV